MKKLLSILLVTLMVFSFAACGGDDETGSNQYGLLNEGKILVAMEAGYPPMEYIDEETGEIVGFDVDMMRAIGEKLGIEVEFKEIAWDGIFMGLTAGTYDVVCSGVSVTQERIDKKEMQFTSAYMNNGQYIIVEEGVTTVNQPEDLAGLNVGVQFETTADHAAKKYQADGVDFELFSYESVQQAFMALEAGQLDVVVADAAVAVAYVNKNADKFDISNAKLTNEPMAIAVAYGNDELTNALNGALAELVSEGKLAELSQKYVQADLTSNIDMNLVSVE